MLTMNDIEVRMLSYGPRTRLLAEEGERVIEPDLLIALEGIGTFKGVTLEDRFEELIRSGKDPSKFALKMHRESTRRGHSSITTSLILQLEVNKCSRAASILLVSPPFASYLQESQRRRMLGPKDFMTPSRIYSESALRKMFEKAVGLAYETYRWLIERGVELEDARYVLPLASKTSLFIAASLESLIGFIIDSENRSVRYYPEELVRIGRLIRREAARVAPILIEARLSFKSPLPTYPYADPYKPLDELIQSIISESGYPDKPHLLTLYAHPRALEHAERVLQNPPKASSLNPLLWAAFLEPLSLVAYHQSIRHRTVPTAVESIYSAAERVLKDPEANLIIPPKVKSSEKLFRRFRETVGNIFQTYEALLDEGANPSDIIYLLPQATRIYTIRTYNAFNLLWPHGYVATRTCSYAQWEERMIAYEVLRAVGGRLPRLGRLMGEKCKMLGYCPEREWCPIILKYHKYDDARHRLHEKT